MSHRMPWIGEALYPPCEIAALVRWLREAQVPIEPVLRGTGLDAELLASPSCRTSVEQALQACRNAMRLVADPELALRAGARSRLADRGMVGLLLTSCDTMRDVVVDLARYQALATPVLDLDVDTSGSTIRILLDEDATDLPDDLRVFLVAFQAMQAATHLQEAAGLACRPIQARFAHAAPVHAAAYERHLGCPCVFDAERHEIRYANDLLAQRPRRANPIAADLLRSGCDDLLAQMAVSRGHAGRVARALAQLRDPGAGMKAVASLMKVSDRTLRRRLAQEGTSFSAIAVQVQCRIATQRLRRSEASVEQVAADSGYSDSANFRRAFIRWTSMSPAQFRRMQQR